ncbi:unnamed protein product [Cylicocyclus nassatus]|uniref:SCP domain-containing protein n=1 Tax=Cylicocyclus nassatus TaxID=53992 RepID=A0AA36GRX9_CYLNA|nr:unnamed protein product [Cylicocyclus nassatus]
MDEMSQKILDFHNTKRMELASGQNKKFLPADGGEMNKLVWDCSLVTKAKSAIKGRSEQNAIYPYGLNTDFVRLKEGLRSFESDFKPSLERWWNEGNSSNPDKPYGDKANYENMVYSGYQRLGCYSTRTAKKVLAFNACVYEE